jgi:polygalacturonase
MNRSMLMAGAVLCLATPASAVDWSRADAIAREVRAPQIPKRQVKVAMTAKTDARAAIQAAIDDLTRKGGGQVVVPSGAWAVGGPLRLRSRIDLHLSKGAVLNFSPDPAAYLPPVKTRWEGAEIMGYSPMIYAADVHDVALTGPGVINGGSDSGFFGWEDKAQPAIDRLRALAFRNAPLAEKTFGEGSYLRPSAVEIVGAHRVLLADYTVRNASFWVNHLTYVDHATVRGIHVDSHQPHNDGVDVDSSRYVLIEKNNFKTGNYSVAIKSGRDLEARTIGRPSQFVVIRDNAMAGSDGVGFGSEMAGGIRDIYVERNIMADAGAAFHFKSNRDRGGEICGVHVRDMKMGNFEEFIWLEVGAKGPFGDNRPPRVSDISFEGLDAGAVGRFLVGPRPPDAPIQGLTLSDITAKSAKTATIVQHVEGLSVTRVEVGGAPLSPPLP